MVKFCKQLELQLVPEWRAKYCNYWLLKKDLKRIMLHGKHEGTDPIPSNEAGIEPTIIHPLTSLTRRKFSNAGYHCQDLIQVHQYPPHPDMYRTELLGGLAEDEYERTFFANLDTEFNKVNHFYAAKEQEYVERGETLRKQLENLMKMEASYEEKRELKAGSSKSCSFSEKGTESEESYGGSSERRQVEMEEGMEKEEGERDEEEERGERREGKVGKVAEKAAQMLWEKVGWDDGNNVTKRKMHYAKKLLRTAYVECYRGLGFMRNFSTLNMLAFAKILKKYDKITGHEISLVYLKVVERSYFNCSDKVLTLMEEVERLFASYFVKDPKKAMMLLRPIHKKASHTITFSIGLFTGCSLAFFLAFLVLIHFDGLYPRYNSLLPQRYMKVASPTFSMLFLILLQMYLYGWNIYLWRQVRINYAFIFEFSPTKELRNREVLLVCTALTTIVTGGMLAHLVVSTNGFSSFNSDIIPLTIIMVFILLLFCPFNIFYRSSRIFFLRCMKRIIFSPFYKVVMADFFLADQLTSQIPMLRYAEYVLCYYFGGYFWKQDTKSCGGHQFHNLAYVISFLPYWWRLMQCLRRWEDEGDEAHLSNGGKYMSAMVAAGMRLTFIYNPTIGWLTMFVVSSSIATIYQIYWDVIRDWGLLQKNSKNPWLRDELILKQRSIYFFSIGLNIFLRFAWLQSVMPLHFDEIDKNVTDFVFASLEVIRRGHWNFYRLENEHINNVGKYRAVKTVPLPFEEI